MQELIDRLRALVDGIEVHSQSQLIRRNGMHDLLLAMEERCRTVSTYSRIAGEDVTSIPLLMERA